MIEIVWSTCPQIMWSAMRHARAADRLLQNEMKKEGKKIEKKKSSCVCKEEKRKCQSEKEKKREKPIEEKANMKQTKRKKKGTIPFPCVVVPCHFPCHQVTPKRLRVDLRVAGLAGLDAAEDCV